MGVKFTELPELSVSQVSSNDKLAVLDVSDGVLKQTAVFHASPYNTFGVGDKDNFGHVKLSDGYEDASDDTSGIAASYLAVNNAHDDVIVRCRTCWVGTSSDWFNRLTDEERNEYTFVCFTDM